MSDLYLLRGLTNHSVYVILHSKDSAKMKNQAFAHIRHTKTQMFESNVKVRNEHKQKECELKMNKNTARPAQANVNKNREETTPQRHIEDLKELLCPRCGRKFGFYEGDPLKDDTRLKENTAFYFQEPGQTEPVRVSYMRYIRRMYCSDECREDAGRESMRAANRRRHKFAKESGAVYKERREALESEVAMSRRLQATMKGHYGNIKRFLSEVPQIQGDIYNLMRDVAAIKERLGID